MSRLSIAFIFLLGWATLAQAKGPLDYSLITNPDDSARIYPIYDPTQATGQRDRAITLGALRTVIFQGYTPGSGDMTRVIYDPQGIEADTFSRSNHTGTQAYTTITGLSTIAHTGSWNDLLNKPTVNTLTGAILLAQLPSDCFTDGQILKRVNGTWACAPDATGEGGSSGVSTFNGQTGDIIYAPDLSSYATLIQLATKADAASIIGGSYTKVTLSTQGIATAASSATTADITDSADRRYVTDAQRIVVAATSGTNTGDETAATIRAKLGAATSGNSGYLSSSDWSIFNAKQSPLVAGTDYVAPTGAGTGLTALNPANVTQTASYRFVTDGEKTTWNAKQNALTPVTDYIPGSYRSIDGTFSGNSDSLVPTQKAAKTYVDTALALKQNVLGFTPVNLAAVGAANGVASLNSSGYVPYTQLGSGGTGAGTKVLLDNYTFGDIPSGGAVGFSNITGSPSDNTNLAAALALKGNITGQTFVTPNIGVATATSVNGLSITSTTGTLTLAAGKTLTANNTMTFSASSDGLSLNIGPGGTLGSAAFTATTAYEVPLTFSTGLTRNVNTITVNSGSTSAAGILQLTDSISSTSTSTAATPNAVKTAYDLANGKVTNPLTTVGDIFIGGTLGTPSRLASAQGVLAATGAGVAPAYTTTPTISLVNATSVPAGQLSGTIPTAVLGNSSFYLGTTSVALNRASASLSLTGISSIDGTASGWTTARTLAGNSVNGTANVAFANKFIVQGTTDTGLSGSQFLGALATGLVKNTTTTGVLSIAAGSDINSTFGSQTANYVYAAPNGSAGAPGFRALVAADIPTLNQNTTGTAGGLTGTPNITVGTVTASGGMTVAQGASAQSITMYEPSAYGTNYATLTVPTTGLTTNPVWTFTDSQILLNGTAYGGSGGGSTTYSATFNNSGSGGASGSTFNGGAALTVSYNTIGAQPLLTNPVTSSAASATAGRVATYTGTGVGIQDSGTLLSALAPLNNASLTGSTSAVNLNVTTSFTTTQGANPDIQAVRTGSGAGTNWRGWGGPTTNPTHNVVFDLPATEPTAGQVMAFGVPALGGDGYYHSTVSWTTAGGTFTGGSIASTIYPSSSDGAALGSTSNMWSDLFLASGGVINFNNSDVTLTHSADNLTLAGGTFVSSTSVETPYIILGSAATAADAGAVRLPNSGAIVSEASPDGTDVSLIYADSLEAVQIGATGATAVVVTPVLEASGGITSTNATATAIDFRDSDVTHGITTVANTNTWFLMNQASATKGGAQLHGFSDTSDQSAMSIRGYMTSNPDDTVPAVGIRGYRASGTGVTALASAERTFSIFNNTTENFTLYGSGNAYLSGSLDLGNADTTLARSAAGRVSIEGVDISTISSTDTLTNKTLTAPVMTNATNNINNSLAAGAYSGWTYPGSSLTTGSVYYYGASGLALAKGDAASTARGFCIAVSTTACLYQGSYRYGSTQSWTVGGPVYVSAATAGSLTQTQPSSSGNYVKMMGLATAADTIVMGEFNIYGVQ